MTENGLPHDERTERALLACLIQHDIAIDEVAPLLSPDDFYCASRRHSEIYAAILALYNAGEPVSSISVERKVGRDDELFSYLAWMADDFTSTSDAIRHARLILADAKRRKIMSASNTSFHEAAHDPDANAVLERALSRLFAIEAQGTSGEWTTLADISYSYLARMSELEKKKGQVSGLPTGFHRLDFTLSGFQPADMLVVAGRPGTGKTSFALSIAYHVAFACEKRVAIFSLEMSKPELFGRLVSMRSQVDGQRLREPWVLTPEEKSRVHQAIFDLESERILIDDTQAISTLEMRSKTRRLHAQGGIDLVIVDYLQLMRAYDSSGKRIKERHIEIAEVSMAIKALAKEFSLPVLALAQLNREVESRNRKVPQLSDLRESGQIEQDSDVVMFLYSEELNDPTSSRKGEVDVIIAKHRNGPMGEVALYFKPQYTQFANIETAVAA